jgi:small-conductance mechanosensitive channel
MNNNKHTKTELFKIFLEIAIGIVLVILFGFVIDKILTDFFPQYKIYELAINESVRSLIVVVIGFMVTSAIIKYIENKMGASKKESYGVISMIVRIVMYIIIIAIVLSIFKISIAGVLAGSTIGGVVLGFAVQTVASNFLSGIFVTSSRTIKYEDIIGINSWIWGDPTIGKIIDIKTFFSKILTKDGNVISIPNSALMGNSVLTEYRNSKDFYLYPLSITTYADVPADKVVDEVRKVLKDTVVYLNGKSGMTNVFLAMIKFQSVEELNKKFDEVNIIFDKAYWKVKSFSYVYGNSIFFNSKDEEGNYLYPLNVTVNADVKADKIIEEVKKSRDIDAHISSRTGSTNVFTVMAKYKTLEDLPQVIDGINLTFDSAYNSLKA